MCLAPLNLNSEKLVLYIPVNVYSIVAIGFATPYIKTKLGANFVMNDVYTLSM
jgi:hypothetical protein